MPASPTRSTAHPAPTAPPWFENVLGALDPTLAEVELQILLRSAIESLDERAQLVIRLRFFEDRSQPEIAETIGVSQSYVSRILRETLIDLRSRMRGAAAS